jgi:NAD(P)-dependent dehydrogenase (short-subunit alcohol dehydrogenase family)
MNKIRKTVLITGTNRGIGLYLSEYLLKNHPENFHYILTTRKANEMH